MGKIKRFTVFIFLSLTLLMLTANCKKNEQTEKAADKLKITEENKMQVWRKATFGMFIHWGVYSYLGGSWHGKAVPGYAEHIFRKEKIPMEEYKKEVIEKFNPAEFDAEEWVRIAKSAGMRYMVITAKHHDGFAMWPSKVTKYNIHDMTPFKRDPMRELRDACRRNGLLFGFYYSHAQDWSHPWGQRNQWDFDHPQPDKRNWWKDPEWKYYIEKSKIYVEEKSIPQLKELIQNYDPDIIWFDTHVWLPPVLTKEIVETARELKPSLIIDSRGTPGIYDYKCTNDRPLDFPPNNEKYWEAIPTTNESYGYNANDHSHKPPEFFIRLLAKAAARGGNLLMNVGPMGNGKIDPVDVKILEGIGKWLKANGESIYGVERTPLSVQAWGQSTKMDDNLYLQVCRWPNNGGLVLGGLQSGIKNIYFLTDKQKKPLSYSRINNFDVRIDVQKEAPDTIDTVIKVECIAPIKSDKRRLLAVNVKTNSLHVFDGELHGKGIAYGSGNPKSNFIVKWKDPQSYVSWPVRLNEKGQFKVSITYTADDKERGNIYEVELGNKKFMQKVKKGRYQKYTLGKVTLNKGEYDIKITAKKIKSEYLFSPTRLNLDPLN